MSRTQKQARGAPNSRGAAEGSATPNELIGGFCAARRYSPTRPCRPGQPSSATSASGGVTTSDA